MNLKEAIEILKENHYKIKSPVLNEADLRFSTADQFLSFTQSRGFDVTIKYCKWGVSIKLDWLF